MSSSSDQWEQFYQQTIPGMAAPLAGITDATIVTTSVNSDTMLCTSNSSPVGGHGQLNSRGSVPKPNRRRSKASKKTPTTHLNANTTNFRALVQQFTGCPSAPSSLGTQRGPINLDFGHGSDQNHGNTSSIMAPFEYGYYNIQQSQPLQQQQQEQQCLLSLDNITRDVFFANMSNHRPNNNMEISNDDFAMENISLHGRTTDSSFNGYLNDGSIL